MDKIVDHVFVFGSEGKIKDYYGNYTDYYKLKLAEEARLARQKSPVTPPKAIASIQENKPRKPSYKEKTEFETLDGEIQSLEALKKEILDKMNSGACGPDELEKLSRNYQETENALEEKTNRWLELSELFE